MAKHKKNNNQPKTKEKRIAIKGKVSSIEQREYSFRYNGTPKDEINNFIMSFPRISGNSYFIPDPKQIVIKNAKGQVVSNKFLCHLSAGKIEIMLNPKQAKNKMLLDTDLLFSLKGLVINR